MRRFFIGTTLSLILAGGLLVRAQDAGLALRTSVGYNTQKASLPLSDDQRREADRLGQEAQRAAQAGKYGDAMKDYQQGLAVMHKVAWTPAYELASSLQERLDHGLAEPGKVVSVTLAPLYSDERTQAIKLLASIRLVAAKAGSAEEKELASGLKLDPAALPFTTRVSLPAAATGDFNLEVRLAADGDAPAEAARPAFVKSSPIHIEALASEAQRLKERLARAKIKDASALTTAEYALALYERADKGEVNPARYNFHAEFSNATAIVDVVDQGRDPFAGKRGDFRKAYRSAVDNTLQPYRMFIPASYSGAKPAPLLVALHGMGGDENSMFDGYGGTLEREAERLGFIVACPKGRDTASMYRGSAEQDVLDVMADVERDYKIDAKRVYLMGHSMGGYGTWSVAIDHPDLFAALGPISGGGDVNGMLKIRNIPEYVVHGDNDKTVNVSQSRRMVEAGRKAGANIVYVEVPGGSHVSVAEPNFAPMLDFFAKQERRAGSEITTQ
ncbi:MAG TPA: prolyl oligopeptidase family serine peptidase [Bryobacteraceae bacterium]|nr:prolyl oligopeptidase family serine peptidase [Bryobacteraceae bacterium]